MNSRKSFFSSNFSSKILEKLLKSEKFANPYFKTNRLYADGTRRGGKSIHRIHNMGWKFVLLQIYSNMETLFISDIKYTLCQAVCTPFNTIFMILRENVWCFFRVVLFIQHIRQQKITLWDASDWCINATLPLYMKWVYLFHVKEIVEIVKMSGKKMFPYIISYSFKKKKYF